jgi:hypothetical protein
VSKSAFISDLNARVREAERIIAEQNENLAALRHLLRVEMAESTSEPVVETVAVAQTSPKFAGNKAAFVLEIVKLFGSRGAVAKEVRQEFLTQKIPHGENAVYDALSYLVGRKKLERKEGRYFVVGKPLSGERLAKSSGSRLSPAGRQRIVDAAKKRWAPKKVTARKAT